MVALYAFCREVDDVVDNCTDSNVARIKLQWWRDEIGRLFAGNPQHPVTHALRPSLQTFNLPQEHFIEIIDGMEMDLDYNGYPSFKELTLYCHRVASMVGLMSAEIFGYQDRGTLRYAQDLGMAFQLTNIVRDVREDAERGRVYVPEDELLRFGVTRERVLALKDSDELHAVLRFQVQRAREYYRKAFTNLPDIDRLSQRSGLIMAAIYQTVLDEIEQDGYHSMLRRVHLTPVRKLWIAWRTARAEKKIVKSRRVDESRMLKKTTVPDVQK
jgi:phytoene synthase